MKGWIDFSKEKVVLTGNPSAQDIQHLQSKRAEGYQFYKLNPDKKLFWS
jgi:hypothetical protein